MEGSVFRLWLNLAVATRACIPQFARRQPAGQAEGWVCGRSAYADVAYSTQGTKLSSVGYLSCAARAANKPSQLAVVDTGSSGAGVGNLTTATLVYTEGEPAWLLSVSAGDRAQICRACDRVRSRRTVCLWPGVHRHGAANQGKGASLYPYVHSLLTHVLRTAQLWWPLGVCPVAVP